MTELLRLYLNLVARLSRWRAEHAQFTPEEAQMLDELDAMWQQLNRHELLWLDQFLSDGKPRAA